MIAFEVYDGTMWVDKTSKVTSLTWKLQGRELEAIEVTLVNDSVSALAEVRVKRNTATIFEGIVYETSRRHHHGFYECWVTAYSKLILYDRHVVFRTYQTGTTAGAIIRDLAALVSGVDVSNVDDGPSLNSPWEIENAPALEVMKSTARGVNYYLRMRPGLMLYFKPKTTSTPVATLDSTNTLSAEYSEDRWKLKNRVVYVGAGGQVLADVSEPPGDMPVVVHDPFLTDAAEAQRRAQIRLTLNKEYGRELRVRAQASVVEAAGIDLFSTVTVNFPNLGLSNMNMYVVEMSYDPKKLEYELVLGGRRELFEEFFEEEVGGDVAARFGQAIKVPEVLSTLTAVTRELGGYARISAATRHPVYVNKPPITMHNASNVTLNSAGEAVLVSGATSGSFEVRFLPPSGLTFLSFVEAYWSADAGGGSASAAFLDADGNTVLYVSDAVATRYVTLPRWPKALNRLTYRSASEWAASGATVSDARLGPIGGWCLKVVPNILGTYGTITYPASGALGLGLGEFRYLRLYLYGDATADFTVRIRLSQDSSNYAEGNITVRAGEWNKYEAALSTFARTGSPGVVNTISISTPQVLLVDSDFVLLGYVYGALRLRFNLSRPSAADASPKISAVRIAWREGGA